MIVIVWTDRKTLYMENKKNLNVSDCRKIWIAPDRVKWYHIGIA